MHEVRSRPKQKSQVSVARLNESFQRGSIASAYITARAERQTEALLYKCNPVGEDVERHAGTGVGDGGEEVAT